MTIATEHEKVHIVFPPEATLATVQEDTEEITRALNEIKGGADVELDCRAIEEIDSCYLQLIVITVCTRKVRTIRLRTGRDNRTMREVLKLYGVVDGRLQWVEDQGRLTA